MVGQHWLDFTFESANNGYMNTVTTLVLALILLAPTAQAGEFSMQPYVGVNIGYRINF